MNILNNKDGYGILKKILKYFKPFKKEMIIVVLCILFSSGLNIIQPLLGKVIMDQGLIKKDISIVITFSLIVLILVLINQGLSLIQTVEYSAINTKFSFLLYRTAFRKLLNFRLTYFDSKNYSEITNNLNIDINNVTRVADRSTFMAIGQIFLIISGIVGLCLVSWQLMLLVLCVLPFKLLIVLFISKKRKKTVAEYLEYNRDFYSWFGDCINGIKEIKLWNLKYSKIGQFIKKQRKIVKSSRKLSYLDNYNQSFETILYQLLDFVLYSIGAVMIAGGKLTVGGLFAFITYSTYITGPISVIINIFYNYTSVLPSAKRLFEFFDTEPEEVFKPNAKSIKLLGSPYAGSITFQNVSFGYNPKNPVIKNANFEILPGEKIAIVGLNGAGKSTLLNLMLRFYEPTSGTISYDGKDIRYLKLGNYRDLFAVVSQDPYLFNASVAENVDLKHNKSSSVISACKKAGADKFIQKLPEKYETIVGRNGARLSGGERQKISVARVFTNDAPVIIFDEATSNFDSFSDDYLNQVIFSQLNKKTVMVITHKTGILKYMDRVFEINNGTVLERQSVIEQADPR